MKELEKVWNIIKDASSKKMELGDIIKQNDIGFFNNLKDELGIGEYDSVFDKYTPHINFIFEAFKDNFEYAGGQRIRYYHSKYVAFLANKISNILHINDDDREIVILSALFHDIGKSNPIYRNKKEESFKEFEKLHNIDHEKLGAEMVFDILKDYDLEKVKKISDTISDKEHSTLHSKILLDADNMGELGSIEVYRSFYYNSLDNTSLDFTIDYWFSENIFKKIKKIEKSGFADVKDMMYKKLQITSDLYNDYKGK